MVKLGKYWTIDPFNPEVKNGKLYGLGNSNAGSPLVCLIQAFLHFYKQDGLPYNLILAATAEEEISGVNGITYILFLNWAILTWQSWENRHLWTWLSPKRA